MLELFGILFGGISRLTQHWMDLADKQKDRDHEHRMLEKQTEIADKKAIHDSELRRMDIGAAKDGADADLLMKAISAQATEAASAGGWAASLSAMVRPLVTLYHAIFLYSAIKIALFIVAYQGGMPWAQAMLSIYGEFDRALLGSMVSYWFADRSLRSVK